MDPDAAGGDAGDEGPEQDDLLASADRLAAEGLVGVAVAGNRERLAALTSPARPVFLKQVHGTQIVRLMPDMPDGAVADACMPRTCGRGAYHDVIDRI